MKRYLVVSLLLLGGVISQIQAQEKQFGIKFSGFVKNDVFLDSRQTIAAREGHFLLFPAAVKKDAYGEDINAKPNFNMLAVQSRLKGAISGPDAFGAKTSGVIEIDFFAQANANINLVRMRHAFVKFDWSNFELLAGQYWNPLFVTDCFPGTVSFNTGTPLQSFARNPQVRGVFKSGGFKVTAAALSQRDYSSRGAAGVSSSYLRNAAMPDIHFQVQYGKKSFVAGAGVAYKTIVPRLESEMTDPQAGIYKVNESVSGLTAIGFAKVTTKPVTVKFEARYGENIADVLAISGFAMKSIVDPLTGEADYTPLTSTTIWGEIHTNGKKFQVGVFGGYFKNMGTKEAIDVGMPVYGLGTSISSLYRISPRVIYNAGKARIALEMEYTSADYGSGFDENYLPASTTTATNIRGLLAFYYFF